MRVPFSRVTIKQPVKSHEITEEVDIAGVHIVNSNNCCSLLSFSFVLSMCNLIM